MTNSIESLRSFALAHNEIEFAHLCTAALEGEEWAVERVRAVLDIQAGRTAIRPSLASVTRAIRATDTARPDGAVARTLREP